MPVLEEADSTTRDLEILLLRGLSEVDLICAECQENRPDWWNYHPPGRSCRTPMCTRCKVNCERFFLVSQYLSDHLECTLCSTNIKINEIRWEKM